MNKHLRFIYLLLLLICLSLHTVMAQADFGSEEEFKKQAAKLFDDEEYEKAYPLYTQLVSLYRKDPNYNYRLGVCIIFAIDDKEKAIPYLEFAVKSADDVDKEAFFYLAKAYHLTYRFDDAIGRYLAYKRIASGAKAERLQVDRQIEMCNNGKKLLQNISDLLVIEKIEMSREDFFRAYDISGLGGKLIVKPDEKEFRTPLDKKKKEKSIIYLAQGSSVIYFSSYGDNEQHGKDIFQMKKLPSGEWGKPQALGSTINTKYDEDFPFLHPNGKTLYFCSKGHNSIGGYDIFKSTLNATTNEWGAPVNMDFPINTPDDDILYISDKDENKAYFSSNRASAASKISVYHINVERKPIEFAMINGTLIKNRKDQEVNAKITIKNLSDNTIVGIFNSKAENGAYEIKLPNGGRFLFTVETPGFANQSEVVEVPVLTEFRALKQEIVYDEITDKMNIKNIFEPGAGGSNYLLAINLIKEKSKLNVSTASDVAVTDAVNDLGTMEDSVSTKVETNTKPAANLSNDDIVKIAQKDANEVENEAKELREQSDIALNFANQTNEQAKSKLQEANDLMAAAAKTDDTNQKQALTEKANIANKEAEQLNSETVAAFNIAKKIDATAAAKQEEADLSQQYAKGLEAAVKAKNPTEALAKLDDLEKKLDALTEQNAGGYPILNSFKKEEENKKRELDKATQESIDLKQEFADNETIISGLKADIEKEKNDQLKIGLTNQMAELKQENTDKQKEILQSTAKVARLKKEYTGIKNETELVNNVVDQSKTITGETAAANAATIDKIKLEEQINTIKTTTSANSNSIATLTPNNSGENNGTKANSSNTNGTATTSSTADTASAALSSSAPITSEKALKDINTKYAKDLNAAKEIKDKGAREAEKAVVLNQWADALDADIVKQKKDYASITDAKQKKQLAKRINESEKSKNDKRKQSEQSFAKAETINKQNGNVAATTTPDNSKNTDTAITANEAGAQFRYTNAAAAAQVTKAKILNVQADTLASNSARLKAKAANESNPETKALINEQSEDVLEQSKEKNIAASQLIAAANESEYTSNKKELDQFSKTYRGSTSSELSKADMINDESVIYFEKSKRLRKNADTAKSLDQKKVLMDEAYKNEIIALNRQKESTTIYKNTGTVAVSTNKTTTGDPASVNSKNDTLQSQNTLATVTTNNTNSGNTNVDKKFNSVKQINYSNPAAAEQIEKAIILNSEADDLMAQAIIPELETVDKTDSKKDKDKSKIESQKLIVKGQLKKLEASKLIADADKAEYDQNENLLKQYAIVSSANTAPDLLKAKQLLDESQTYFEKGAQQRKNVDKATSYYANETLLEDAHDNEIIALKKQKESLDLYKQYNPDFTPATVNALAATTPNNKKNITTEVSEKKFGYSNPAASQFMARAIILNDEADILMAQSVIPETTVKTKENKAKSEELVKEAQSKKMQAAQLIADADNAEYTANKSQFGQFAKASETNMAPDLLKAELLNDESQKYFDKGALQRKNAEQATSYFAKETLLEDAHDNELIALKKQKESLDIYKSYNPDFVSTDANSVAATSTGNKTNTSSSAVSKNKFEYNNPVATEQMAQAVILNDEADNLMAQSVIPETTVKTKENTANSEALINQAQTKRLQAAQLIAAADNAEYTSNKNQLGQLAKASETNMAAELLKAELLNEESQKYFDKGAIQRNNAEQATSYFAKETLLEDAHDNELIALKKQKESLDIYKNYNPENAVSSGIVAKTTNNTNNISGNTAVNNSEGNTSNINTTTNTTNTTNNNNNNTGNNSSPNSTAVNTAGNTAGNSSNDSGSGTTTSVDANENGSVNSEKQFDYSSSAAMEQSVKAASLNKQAADITALSLELKTQAVTQSNNDAKNTMYAQSEELIKEAQTKKLEAAQLTAAANATEYASNQNQVNQLAAVSANNTAPDLLKAEILNDEAQRYFDKAKTKRKEAAATNLYYAKETILEEANKNEMLALEKQKSSLDIYRSYNPDFVATPLNTIAINTGTNSVNGINNSSSTTDPDNTNALAANKAVANTVANTSSSEITLAPDELFEQKSVPVYSAKNPIPINSKLPDGLIFKVQIGAFRKVIPQNLFQGMMPVNGETTAKGFIRYTAGVFSKFATADNVKAKIIKMGYKDAFVVAFLNGKRIPINEAYAMAEGVPATVLQVNNAVNTNTSQNNQTVNTQTENTQTTSNITTNSNPVAIAKSESLTTVSGLFYTVQVGVFSQPVLASKLYNMSPLYTETASNGYLRYYTGVYKTAGRASEAKDMVVDIGVRDAFVTAYYNGKRISLAEAKQYETQGDAVFSTSPVMNKLPTFIANPQRTVTVRNPTVDEEQTEEQPQVSAVNPVTQQLKAVASQNNTMEVESGVIFKVQIGAFNEEVPIEMANKFLKIATRGIKNYKDNTGLTIYTVGNFKTYNEANILKAEVVAESLTDAFVVAYRDGDKISVDEAKQIK